MATVTAAVRDALSIAASSVLRRRVSASAGDVLNVSARTGLSKRLRAALRDIARIAPLAAGGLVMHARAASRLSLGGAWRVGQFAVIRSALAFRGRLTAAQKVRLADGLRLHLRQDAAAHYRRTVRELVRLADHLPRMRIGASLREAVRFRSELARSFITTGQVASRLELSDVLGYTLVVSAFARDELLLDSFDALQAIYHGVLSDEMDFVVDIVSPAGDVTTWAVNSRTGAVTEYLNYAFNSFAPSANGTYLGAADDGLYELAGPDDAGEPIIADIISGLVDFSGVNLSTIQAVYLGVRAGTGQFFLKITEATGRSITYAVKPTSLKTARVNVGKGLRARFFTYELVSTGQAFDLIDITFLPVGQTRRV